MGNRFKSSRTIYYTVKPPEFLNFFSFEPDILNVKIIGNWTLGSTNNLNFINNGVILVHDLNSVFINYLHLKLNKELT